MDQKLATCLSRELLLTSAGLTTDSMREQLWHIVKSNKKQHEEINILRIADGWTRFDRADRVSYTQRAQQHFETSAAKCWADAYLKYLLGRSVVNTVFASNCSQQLFDEMLERSDLLLIPGGNTYQTIKGLSSHSQSIKKHVLSQNLPYLGDSAGSIVAGINISAASLRPADIKPPNLNMIYETGLGLINGDIVTHASGSEGRFAVAGIKSALAERILKIYETPTDQIDLFLNDQEADNVPTYILHNKQAIYVTDSIVVAI